MKILLAFVLSLAATTGFAFPTVWRLANETGSAVTIDCAGKARGLPFEIPFSQTLEAQGELEYEWTTYHNDGLGLNYAEWACLAENSDGLQVRESFKTDWNETILLRLLPSGQGFIVTKTTLE